MARTYEFRREDNGAIVCVNFETMMTQDSAGFITLKFGETEVIARRINQSSQKLTQKVEPTVGFSQTSDALGFIEDQFQDFEEDRKRHNFSGVEFVRDPNVPAFFQAKFSSRKEWERYVKHRGSVDMNSENGGTAALSPKDFDDAKKKMLDKYPVNKS